MSSTTPTDPAKTDARKRSRFRAGLARTAFGLAVGATLVGGWYAIERTRGRASWERYEAQARAAGVKLDMADYLPPEVPDAENFASMPIFQKAFRAVAEGREVPRPFEWLEGGRFKRPAMADAVTGQTIDLAAWQSYFVSVKMIPATGIDPAADVLAALEKFDPALAQLREAGQRPGCRFPVKWENGFAAAMPHISLLNASTRIFALRIAAHLALGENEAAYEDFRDALRIYTATAQEPTLIAALVRQTIPASLSHAVWDGLARRQWKDADLVRIERDLQAVNALADYQRGMGSERALSNLFYPQFRRMSAAKVGEILSIAQPAGANGANASWRGRLFLLYPQGWVYRNQERSNHYFDDLLGRVSVDPPRLYIDRPATSGPENLQGGYDRWRFFLFALAAPAFQAAEARFGYTQTLAGQARLGSALERYRLARGKFPAQLSELVPEFMPSVPNDVMNGQPYRYRLSEAGGYVLYSVASNLTDDEGQAGPERSIAKQLDWVWTMPAESAPSQ